MTSLARIICVMTWVLSRPLVAGAGPSARQQRPTYQDCRVWMRAQEQYLIDRLTEYGLVANSNTGRQEVPREMERLGALYRDIFPGDEFQEAVDAISAASIPDPWEPHLPPASEFGVCFYHAVGLCDSMYEVYHSPSRDTARGCLDATAALLRRRADRFGTPYSYERDLFGRMFTGLKDVPYLDVEAVLTSWANGRGGRPPQGGGPPVALAVGAVAAVALTAGLVLHRRRRP